MGYLTGAMRKRVSAPIVRLEETEDGTYRWVLEYDEEVTRMEHVEIPLFGVDPDDPEKAKRVAAELAECPPSQVRVEL